MMNVKYTVSYKSVITKLLLAVTLIFSAQFFAPVSFAVELNPSDHMKPSQSQPTLGNLPEESSLIIDESNVQKSNSNKKNTQNWWNWLTCTSKKPANFHYIDIIELFS